jgi:hypothetical protein
MTTAECHRLLDSFDTRLTHDYHAVRRFNGIKRLNDSSTWHAGCALSVQWFRQDPKTHAIMSRTIETISTPDVLNSDHVTIGRQVPFCVFTDSGFARVGFSEKQTQNHGVPWRLFKAPTEGVLRAHTVSEACGSLRALMEIDGDRILGFTVRGSDCNDCAALHQAARCGSDASHVTGGLHPAICFPHPRVREGLTRGPDR